jgi:hypothetical protein
MRMRKKRPIIATLDEVQISRNGEEAIIEYRDDSISTVHLQVGPGIGDMTDAEILEMNNDVIRVQQMMKADHKCIPKEIPPGRPQLEYKGEFGQPWTPRGGVLRCEISDGGPDCETTIIIDDHEFSMEEFGQIISTYNGWGMRIVFVDVDDMEIRPIIEICEPEDGIAK